MASPSYTVRGKFALRTALGTAMEFSGWRALADGTIRAWLRPCQDLAVGQLLVAPRTGRCARVVAVRPTYRRHRDSEACGRLVDLELVEIRLADLVVAP